MPATTFLNYKICQVLLIDRYPEIAILLKLVVCVVRPWGAADIREYGWISFILGCGILPGRHFCLALLALKETN